MGRGRLLKIDIQARVLKLKNDLHEGRYNGASEEWMEGAHYQLNQVLNIIDEYSCQWKETKDESFIKVYEKELNS